MSENIPHIDRDSALVRDATQGSLAAFEELVKRHQGAMFRIAFHILGDVGEAADAVQEAFLSAYRNMKGFGGRSKFSTWLAAITANMSKNRLRSAKRRQADLSIHQGGEERGDESDRSVDPPSLEPSALFTMEREEIRRKVRACIGKLDPDFRSVLVLKEMQEMAYDEIAESLSIAIGTVKSRLSRAREAVKECLKRTGGVIA